MYDETNNYINVHTWLQTNENQIGIWAMLGWPLMLSRLNQFQTLLFWGNSPNHTRSSLLILGDGFIPMTFYVSLRNPET